MRYIKYIWEVDGKIDVANKSKWSVSIPCLNGFLPVILAENLY